MQAEALINTHRLKRRYSALLTVFLLCFTVLVGRLVVLQVIKHGEYRAKARDNIESVTPLRAERGIIYDRNMVKLAVNMTAYRVFVSPRDVKSTDEAEKIANGLSQILSVDRTVLLKGISDRRVRDRTVKKRASEQERLACLEYISENGLGHCVHLEATPVRYYPYGSLAANVIGFVGTDGGLIGIESYYDAYLKGQDGVYISEKNASGQTLPNSADKYIKAVNGSDVILTIDVTLQSMLEAQLKQTFIDSQARERVTGVALDPETGEVLAMATYPSFDLNDPYVLSDFYQARLDALMLDGGSEEYRKAKNSLLYEMWGNKAVSVLYEPGSTFKIVTTSVALEEKVSTVSEGFFCSGALKIDGYGTPIRCHKRQGHGALSFAEALQKSCNPTMIRLAERIGTQRFMSYFKSFGYTGKTGIDLPGEALGIFHSENGFGNVELSVYAFGQTFKTTPIQQISAVSAVANGGELLSPYVVKEICDASGATVYRGGGKVRGKVLSKSVCDTISGILCDGVNGDGGAKNAGVAGYRIAAKTGTSQKRDIKTENLYVGSCVAYSVNEEGSISVIIAVDEPQCAGYYGSTVAAPYVSEFLKGALPYLGVEPSYTAEEEARLNVCAPSLVGMSVAEAKKEAALSGVTVTVIGSGEQVVSQMPKAQTLINREGGRVIVYTEGECSDYGKVPSVVGLTASEAIKALINAGFNFRLCGATSETAQAYATVIAQDCAGAELKLGSSVSLWLRYDDKE